MLMSLRSERTSLLSETFKKCFLKRIVKKKPEIRKKKMEEKRGKAEMYQKKEGMQSRAE